MACGNFCTQADLAQLSAPSISVSGAAGEKFAKVILSDKMSLKAYSFTRMSNNKGLDLAMHNPSQRLVVVEVKTSAQEKPFSQLLGRGYNVPERGGMQKQGSVGWLQGVREHALGRGKHADRTIRESLNQPENVPVLGVQINPKTQTAHIFIRTDQDAFEWTPMTSVPLRDYVR